MWEGMWRSAVLNTRESKLFAGAIDCICLHYVLAAFLLLNTALVVLVLASASVAYALA